MLELRSLFNPRNVVGLITRVNSSSCINFKQLARCSYLAHHITVLLAQYSEILAALTSLKREWWRVNLIQVSVVWLLAKLFKTG